MFYIYCLVMFASQFNYILSFDIGGFTIEPVKLLSIILIIFGLIKRKNQSSKIRVSNSWYKALIVWIFWTILSIIWAQSKIGTIKVLLIFIEALIFIYYGLLLIENKQQFKFLLNTMIVALIIHLFFCFLEINYGMYFFTIYGNAYASKGYPASTFFNTNNIALYLCLLSYICLFTRTLEKNRIKKVLYLILFGVSIYFLVQTRSRGAIIAEVISMIIFLILEMRDKRATLLIIILGLLSSSIIIMVPKIQNSINVFLEDNFTIETNLTYGSDYYRKNAYLNGIDFLKKTYGFGTSPGNVEFWMENYGTRPTHNIKPLHNWWLEILVSSGFVVTFVVLKTWITYFSDLIKMYLLEKTDREKIYRIAIAVSICIAFAIGCISPSSLYKQEWPWALLTIMFLMKNNI